jgi:hypothetical protein
VRDGRFVRFRPLGTHKLITRRGLFQLPEPFDRLLLEELRVLLQRK